MEFDRDWIVPAIFVGVMLVRAVGSRISRASKKAQPKVAQPMKQPPSKGFAHPDDYRPGDQPKPMKQPPSKGFAHPDVYRPGDQPKPIEPR